MIQSFRFASHSHYEANNKNKSVRLLCYTLCEEVLGKPFRQVYT